MKKLLFLFILLTVMSFSGCANTADTNSSDLPIVVVPDNETRKSLNGYRDPAVPFYEPEDESGESENVSSNSYLDRSNAPYFGNKTSKKYHIFDCTYAVNIRDENLALFATSADAENSGYEPCQKCLQN